MKHKIFIGNYPEIENYIDGTKIKPQDTKFEGNGVLVFHKVPRNLKEYLKHSTYPIYILLQDSKNIPYQYNSQFDIVFDSSIWSIRKFVENIFFNPDRLFVYCKLITYKPPVMALWGWIRRNAMLVYGQIPEVLLELDEKVIMTLDGVYFYILVSLGLDCSNNVRKLQWTQKQ